MVKFIADIGSNHNGSMYRAIKLIDKAKQVDCYGVKFQYFEVDKLYHPSTKIDFELLKKRELPLGWISELCEYAKKIELAFGMTFFHTGVMNQFEDCQFDFIKISSFDTGRDDLIREALICTPERLIISTGLMMLPEIFMLNQKIAEWESQLAIPHKELTLMHCISSYPAKNGQLLFLRKMIREGWECGYSDHVVDYGTMVQAAIMGAEYIEFHLDLEDEKGFENIGHCWEGNHIKKVIEHIGFLDKGWQDKIITDEQLMWKADKDGMRPGKMWRIERRIK